MSGPVKHVFRVASDAREVTFYVHLSSNMASPCAPFTDPVDLSWYTAAELNEECCAQKSLCCRVNGEGGVTAAPFFHHGAGPTGSPTLNQARAFCGVTGTADDSVGSAPQTIVTTSTSGSDTHNKTIWIIVAVVLGTVLLVVVYLYFAASNRKAPSGTLSPRMM